MMPNNSLDSIGAGAHQGMISMKFSWIILISTEVLNSSLFNIIFECMKFYNVDEYVEAT